MIESLEKLNKTNKEDFLLENGFFEGCIIIDWLSDMVTPLLLSFTYQSLLDEFFGFRFNSIMNVK